MSLSKTAVVTQVKEEVSSSSATSGHGTLTTVMMIGGGGLLVFGVGFIYYYYYYCSSGKEDGVKEEEKDKKKKTAKIKPNQRSLDSRPKDLCLQLKEEGNNFFRLKDYKKALESYSKAIDACQPTESSDVLSTLFQNRAAAQEALKAGDDVIVKDCTTSLGFNGKNLKALLRRSRAYERQGKYREALSDVTGVCILESFGQESSLLRTDSLLKKVSVVKAGHFLETRPRVSPSSHFVRHYFSSFCHSPFSASSLPDLEERAREAIDDDERKLIRATIALLSGETESAQRDLESLVESASSWSLSSPPSSSSSPSSSPEKKRSLVVNALIKLGSLKGSQPDSSLDSCLQLFDRASKLDPNNADVFLHRSQLLILHERVEEARLDLKRAVELAPNFVSAAAQSLYVDFRLALSLNDMDRVKQVLKEFAAAAAADNFASSSEVHSLFAQALMESGDLEAADTELRVAIACDPEDANLHVHRAILLLQRNDRDGAEELLKEATRMDDSCHFAHEMLGSLLVQKGSLTQGIASFDAALKACVSRVDAEHLFCLREAAAAQLEAALTLGIPLPEAAQS
jgi:import receptor subunit TOM70